MCALLNYCFSSKVFLEGRERHVDTKLLLGALQEVEKRAERVSEDEVLATYVNIESLTNALAARDNGIVFGRRGTGKTHALKFVAQTERDKGNRVVYIDMEQDVGSTEGRYADPNLSVSERATRLVVDVLSIVHSQMLEAAFAGSIEIQIDVLDQMLDHFQEVLVAQETEQEDTRTDRSSEGSKTDLGVNWTPGGMPSMKVGAGWTREAAREGGRADPADGRRPPPHPLRRRHPVNASGDRGRHCPSVLATHRRVERHPHRPPAVPRRDAQAIVLRHPEGLRAHRGYSAPV